MGDAEMAQKRLGELQARPLLAVNRKAEELASELVTRGALPEKAAVDALHIAVPRLTGWSI